MSASAWLVTETAGATAVIEMRNTILRHMGASFILPDWTLSLPSIWDNAGTGVTGQVFFEDGGGSGLECRRAPGASRFSRDGHLRDRGPIAARAPAAQGGRCDRRGRG